MGKGFIPQNKAVLELSHVKNVKTVETKTKYEEKSICFSEVDYFLLDKKLS